MRVRSCPLKKYDYGEHVKKRTSWCERTLRLMGLCTVLKDALSEKRLKNTAVEYIALMDICEVLAFFYSGLQHEMKNISWTYGTCIWMDFFVVKIMLFF